MHGFTWSSQIPLDLAPTFSLRIDLEKPLGTHESSILGDQPQQKILKPKVLNLVGLK